MSTGAILLIVLLVLVIGGAPVFPYSRSWGFGPSGIGMVLLVVLLVLFATDRI